MIFELLSSPFYNVFMVSFMMGFLFGFIVHGILRAPRWLVAMLTTNE